jgi:hypothetical protein
VFDRAEKLGAFHRPVHDPNTLTERELFGVDYYGETED